MSKLLDKIMAPFYLAATPVSDDEITALVETPRYLHDTAIATVRPYYRFSSVEEALNLLGLHDHPAKATKLPRPKTMGLYSCPDHLSGIETFVLSGPSIEISIILKSTNDISTKPLQLDAITVREGNVRTCLACGPEGASRECVDLFLGCFREAADALQCNPSLQTQQAEEALKGHLLIAFRTLSLERILADVPENPSLSKH